MRATLALNELIQIIGEELQKKVKLKFQKFKSCIDFLKNVPLLNLFLKFNKSPRRQFILIKSKIFDTFEVL